MRLAIYPNDEGVSGSLATDKTAESDSTVLLRQRINSAFLFILKAATTYRLVRDVHASRSKDVDVVQSPLALLNRRLAVQEASHGLCRGICWLSRVLGLALVPVEALLTQARNVARERLRGAACVCIAS